MGEVRHMMRLDSLATVNSLTLSNTSLASESFFMVRENDSNVRVWKLSCDWPCSVCGRRLTRDINGYGICSILSGEMVKKQRQRLAHISFSESSSYRNMMWWAVRWRVPVEIDPALDNTTCSTWREVHQQDQLVVLSRGGIDHLRDSNCIHGRS